MDKSLHRRPISKADDIRAVPLEAGAPPPAVTEVSVCRPPVTALRQTPGGLDSARCSVSPQALAISWGGEARGTALDKELGPAGLLGPGPPLPHRHLLPSPVPPPPHG